MKKLFLLLLVIVGLFNIVQAQNAITGTGFTNGFGSSCSDNANFTYFTTSAGTTYTSGDLTPKAIGDQSWRLAIGTGGVYSQISGGIDMAIAPGVKTTTASLTCTTTGTYYRNVSALTNRYVFKTLNAGTTPTGIWVFFELGGASTSVSSVVQYPAAATVYLGNQVTVNATLSAAFPTGQGAYLRYTTDNFATSTVVPMIGSGTFYTATIPAQSASTNIKYIVFTSGSGLTISSSDADLYTINYNNNSGSNYSYTVTTNPYSLTSSVLIDFGGTDGTFNKNSASPTSGNYWNNFTYPVLNGTSPANFVDKTTGALTNFNAVVTTAFTINNTVSLGLTGTTIGNDLQTDYATMDAFYAGTANTKNSIDLTGLNPVKRYRFYIFGCRPGADQRVSRYTLTGSTTTSGDLQTTFTNLGGTGINGNTTNLYISPLISPNATTSKISLDVVNAPYATGTKMGYLNCLKMEEYKGANAITFGALPSKAIGDADYAPGASSSSGLAISYASSNTAVATIVSGQIHIVGAGTTTITASQAGDATYEAATSVPQTLIVNTRNIIVCNFDNVNTTTGAWGGNSITSAINPSGGGNVGLVSVPANNVAGITFTTTDKINTATHNKIRFKVYATQAFSFTSEKLDDKTNGAIYYNVGQYPAYTTPNQWQELTLDISSATANIYDRITLLASAWSNLPAFTYYIDDLTLVRKPVITYYKSLYFDFGFTSTPTTGADSNGNTWNNIMGVPPAFTYLAAGTAFNNLVDSINTPTTYNLVLQTAGFTPNGGSGAGLMAPEVAQLGKFAIASATEDFFMTTSASENFKMTGLDPNKGYVFSFFGSRSQTEIRTTKFSLVGANATAVEGTVTSSGVGIGTVAGAAVNYNTNSIYTSTPITPAAAGAITVTLTKAAGSWTHLNVMKIMEFKGQQTITLAATANKTIGDADFSPATASSGLAISYSSSNIAVATIVAGQVHIVGIGTTTITAYQAGNTSYDPAVEVTQELTVKGTSSITATGITSFTYNATAQGPSTSTVTGSLGAVTYSYSGTGYAATATKPTNAGTYQVVASVAADANYNAASSSALGFTIGAATPSISVSGTQSFTYNGSAQGPATVSYNGDGTTSLLYTSTDGAGYSSATPPVNAGAYKVVASATAGTNYNAGTSTDYIFTIAKATQTISFGALSSVKVGDADFAPGATSATSGVNAITYSSSENTVASIISNQIHPVGVGNCTIYANQASSANYDAATEVSQNLAVAARSIILVDEPKKATEILTIPTADVALTSTLTIDADKSVNNLTVSTVAKIVLPSDKVLIVNGNLDLKADLTNSFSVNLGSSSISVPSGVVRYLKTINDTKWHFISFPCIVDIASIKQSNGTSLGLLGTDWYIKYYDGKRRADEGSNLSNWISITPADLATAPNLEANKGYIIGLATNIGVIKEIAFPLDKAILLGEATSIPVSVNSGKAASQNHGWNLVGQPYLSKYDVVGAGVPYIYFVKTGGVGYDYYLPSDGTKIVNPFSSYFVQSTGNTTVTFDTDLRQSVRSSVSTNVSDNVQLNFSSASGTDRTNIVIDNEMSSNYVLGQDLEKWFGSASAVYTVLGGMNYALNSLPLTSVNNLALGYYTQLAGNATISVNASQAKGLSALLLTDNSTSPITVTDLLTSSYSFNATAGTTTNRFVLSARKISTANEYIGKSNEPQVLILNSQLEINNLTANSIVRVFDALGRMLISRTMTSNTLQFNAPLDGIYTVQIQSVDKYQSIKVLVKK